MVFNLLIAFCSIFELRAVRQLSTKAICISSEEVAEVFTRKKKMGNNSGVRKPQNRLLRLFRSNDLPQGALISLGDTDREDAYSADQKMIGNAMLEFEYQSAKARLAFEHNQRFY